MIITYRRASVKDLRFIKAINEQCLPENYPDFLWQALLTDMNLGCYVALDQDKIIGYITLNNVGGTGWMLGLDDKYHTITSLAVLPDYRRRGIARKLMTLAIKCVTPENYKPVDLHVRASNMAMELYKSFGFKVKTVSTDYYLEPDEDGYHMVLTRMQ